MWASSQAGGPNLKRDQASHQYQAVLTARVAYVTFSFSIATLSSVNTRSAEVKALLSRGQSEQVLTIGICLAFTHGWERETGAGKSTVLLDLEFVGHWLDCRSSRHSMLLCY